MNSVLKLLSAIKDKIEKYLSVMDFQNLQTKERKNTKGREERKNK